MSDASLPLAQTKKELYLNFLSGNTELTIEKLPVPLTREETYLATLCGINELSIPEPITREDMYLKYLIDNGGVGGSTIKQGEYIAPITTQAIYTNDKIETATVDSQNYVEAPPTENISFEPIQKGVGTIMNGDYVEPTTT